MGFEKYKDIVGELRIIYIGFMLSQVVQVRGDEQIPTLVNEQGYQICHRVMKNKPHGEKSAGLYSQISLIRHDDGDWVLKSCDFIQPNLLFEHHPD